MQTAEQLARQFGIVAKPAKELPKNRWAVYHSDPYQARILVEDNLTLEEVKDTKRFPLGKVLRFGIAGVYTYALMNEYAAHVGDKPKKVSRTEYLGGVHINAISDIP